MPVKPVTMREGRVLGGDTIKLHPDGKPWGKCCKGVRDDAYSCQCFMRKPKMGKPRFDSFIGDGAFLEKTFKEMIAAKERFFCVHRKDGEYHRVCAGWAAKFNKEGAK